MAFYGPIWPFMAILLCFMALCGKIKIGLVSSFLAVIDQNSFGLVYNRGISSGNLDTYHAASKEQQKQILLDSIRTQIS